MHAHTNLKLEQRLEFYETGLLPWDIEMVVEESLSDDEDGTRHRVAESESESESEKDSEQFLHISSSHIFLFLDMALLFLHY